MNLYISTTLRNDVEAEALLSFLERYDGSVGLEIFPLCHIEGYFKRLEKYLPWLATLPITFHEPYYCAEHSDPKGSPLYHTTVGYCRTAFEFAARLRARHVIFHLNNRAVVDREWMLAHALKNLREMAELADAYGLSLLVENTGIVCLRNVLLGQEKFVHLFDEVEQDCLIDIGHAHCNGWDLGVVTKQLSGRIRAYHVHNNFGVHDDHNRIYDGTLDVERFMQSYAAHTPTADIVIEYNPELLAGNVDWLEEDIAWICRRAESCHETRLVSGGDII